MKRLVVVGGILAAIGCGRVKLHVGTGGSGGSDVVATTGAGGRGGTGGAWDSIGGTGRSIGAPRTLGVVGCSFATNVMVGYQKVGGTRMWPPISSYESPIQRWTPGDSSAWRT